MMTRKVVVNDTMQNGYVYSRTEPVGRNFAPGFTPQLTPKEMLRARRVRREIHDRLPRRVSGELVRQRPVVRRAARPAPQLLWRERVAVARGVAPERLDSSAGSPRMVPVVLPVLHGPEDARRRAADSPVAGHRDGMSPPSGSTASRATSTAAGNSGRPYCTGPTIAAGCERCGRPSQPAAASHRHLRACWASRGASTAVTRGTGSLRRRSAAFSNRCRCAPKSNAVSARHARRCVRGQGALSLWRALLQAGWVDDTSWLRESCIAVRVQSRRH